MKKLLLTAAVLFGGASLTTSTAQLPDGSIAPDWTLTDINGQTHSLYADYLDQGKTVVLDVFATWCSPCWSYASSGVLDQVWSQYGPNGTNEIIVFSIEADGQTTSADLNGTGSNTQGDWTSLITNYLIDDASVNTPYQIAYFPTIYMICPNRLITEVGQLQSASAFYSAHQQNCGNTVANGSNNGALFSYTGETVACGPTDVLVQLQNMGTSNLTSATITVSDGSSTLLTYNYTGNLATYDIADVNLGQVTPTSATTYTITITDVNGGADANTTDNTLTQQISMSSDADGVVTLTLLLDDYPTETSWSIKNSNGTTLYSGGNYTSADKNTTITESFYLANTDCYRFELNDSYGDGLGAGQWGGTDGNWSLKDENNVVISSGSGDFGDQVIGKFNLLTTPASVEENAIEGLNIYPNPFTTNATVTFQTANATEVVIEVVNMLGEIVSSENLGEVYGVQNYILNGAELENGIYMVNVKAGSNISTARIVLNK